MIYSNISSRYRVGIAVVTCAIVYPTFIMAKYPAWVDKKPRPERTVIITRAASDLGKATVYHFAIRKCRVILGCENYDECRAIRRQMIVDTNNRSLICRKLDMEDVDSINTFVDEISDSEPHIDILVNNTTYRSGNKEKMTKHGVEKHLLQNFLGHYLLTLRLLPKLEKSAEYQRDSRIVIQVEKPKKGCKLDLDDINFEKRRYTNDRAYKQSHLALAYFTIMLDKKLRDQHSKICVFGQGSKAATYQTIFDQDEGKGFWYMLKLYYTASPITITHLSVKLGLDEGLGLRDSGKLFSYIFRCWGKNNGWGRISASDPIATFAWNYAADFLLNLPEAKDGVVSNGPPVADEAKK